MLSAASTADGARREAAFRAFLRHVLPDDSLALFCVLLIEQLALRRPHLPDLRAYLGDLDLPEPIIL